VTDKKHRRSGRTAATTETLQHTASRSARPSFWLRLRAHAHLCFGRRVGAAGGPPPPQQPYSTRHHAARAPAFGCSRARMRAPLFWQAHGRSGRTAATTATLQHTASRSARPSLWLRPCAHAHLCFGRRMGAAGGPPPPQQPYSTQHHAARAPAFACGRARTRTFVLAGAWAQRADRRHHSNPTAHSIMQRAPQPLAAAVRARAPLFWQAHGRSGRTAATTATLQHTASCSARPSLWLRPRMSNEPALGSISGLPLDL
jgi:hypothetical protein